jgi:hypothetical protein
VGKSKRKNEPTRLEALQGAVKPLGLTVADYSPGDGVTRYKVLPEGSGYFGPADAIYTAVGYKEVNTFVTGLVQGAHRATPKGFTREQLGRLLGLVEQAETDHENERAESDTLDLDTLPSEDQAYAERVAREAAELAELAEALRALLSGEGV